MTGCDAQFTPRNKARPIRVDRATFIEEISNSFYAAQNHERLPQQWDRHVHNVACHLAKQMKGGREGNFRPNLAAHFSRTASGCSEPIRVALRTMNARLGPGGRCGLMTAFARWYAQNSVQAETIAHWAEGKWERRRGTDMSGVNVEQITPRSDMINT